MSKEKWTPGYPPHPGWWPAQIIKIKKRRWGWFDGVGWSVFIGEMSTPEFAGRAARQKGGIYQDPHLIVSWSNYYPKSARVPRINPNKKG
jgi:hypothetical protein